MAQSEFDEHLKCIIIYVMFLFTSLFTLHIWIYYHYKTDVLNFADIS